MIFFALLSSVRSKVPETWCQQQMNNNEQLNEREHVMVTQAKLSKLRTRCSSVKTVRKVWHDIELRIFVIAESCVKSRLRENRYVLVTTSVDAWYILLSGKGVDEL
jgi:hypothetical protein